MMNLPIERQLNSSSRWENVDMLTIDTVLPPPTVARHDRIPVSQVMPIASSSEDKILKIGKASFNALIGLSLLSTGIGLTIHAVVTNQTLIIPTVLGVTIPISCIFFLSAYIIAKKPSPNLAASPV